MLSMPYVYWKVKHSSRKTEKVRHSFISRVCILQGCLAFLKLPLDSFSLSKIAFSIRRLKRTKVLLL